MIKKIEAIYEDGIIRPVEPLESPEGTRLDLILSTDEKPCPNDSAAEILAEIAAQPMDQDANFCIVVTACVRSSYW